MNCGVLMRLSVAVIRGTKNSGTSASAHPTLAHPLPSCQTVHTRPVGPDDIGAELPLLINAATGSTTAQRTEELMAAFSSAGVRVAIEVAEPHQFTPRLKALVESGAPSVGIGGGDGTVSSAVDILAGTSTVLIP